jgi:hypothetical protein
MTTTSNRGKEWAIGALHSDAVVLVNDGSGQYDRCRILKFAQKEFKSQHRVISPRCRERYCSSPARVRDSKWVDE